MILGNSRGIVVTRRAVEDIGGNEETEEEDGW